MGIGLDALGHVLDLYDRPERVLLAIGSAFDFPADYLPENVRYVGPLLDPPGWSKPWIAPWPQGSDRPRALVSFSTTFQNQADALQRVVKGLGRDRNRCRRDNRPCAGRRDYACAEERDIAAQRPA